MCAERTGKPALWHPRLRALSEVPCVRARITLSLAVLVERALERVAVRVRHLGAVQERVCQGISSV